MNYSRLFSFSYFLLVVALFHQLTDLSSAESSFPEGWCDLKFGNPTRTTGECVCLKNCIGHRCQHSQGLSWYSFKECPTCKCVVDSTANTKTSPPVPLNTAQSSKTDDDQHIIDHGHDKDDEIFFDFIYWIEENGRLLFGLLVTILVLVILIPSLFIITSPPKDSEERTSEAKKID